MNNPALILSVVTLGICTKVNVLAYCINEDVIEKYYCILSLTVGRTKFSYYAGSEDKEFDLCIDSQFFDYGIDPEMPGEPKGCTPCPDGKHIGRRNFCPFCFPCREEDEVKTNETKSIICLVDDKLKCLSPSGPSTAPIATDDNGGKTGELGTTEETESTSSTSRVELTVTPNPTDKLVVKIDHYRCVIIGLSVISVVLAIALSCSKLYTRRQNATIDKLQKEIHEGSIERNGDQSQQVGSNERNGNQSPQADEVAIPLIHLGSNERSEAQSQQDDDKQETSF